QQLGAGVIERGEADFVDDDQVVAQQCGDDAADGVVGQAAVEGPGQVGGGVVADLVPGLDRRDAQGDQQMALAGSRRADHGDDRDTCETGHGLMLILPNRGLTCGLLSQWSVVRWLSASALSCSVGKLYCRVVSRRECPMSSATTIRSVLP